MSDVAPNREISPEALLHARVRELAEAALLEDGIQLDHVFIRWDRVETLDGRTAPARIASLSISTHSHPVFK